MAYATMDKFTDELLKKKIFDCKMCDELCTSNIFFVLGKGNVCGKCFEEKCGEEIRSRAELNTAHMSIMSELILPCKFQWKGCDKRVASNIYSKHIRSCDFKIKPCPMKNPESCDWSGCNFELTDHLFKIHDKHVIKGDNNIFKVKTSLLEPFNVKILSFDWRSYLLRTVIADNKWFYAVNPLDENDESMEYSVVHRSISIPNLLIKTEGTLTKLNGFYNEQNLNNNPNATAIDMDTLKHLTNEENMFLNDFNLNPKGLDENMLKLLECPVCMSIMRPPIFQCNLGHNICILCRQKVNQCPTCEGQWTDVRSLFMENFTLDVKYPCKFKQFGCKEIDIESKLRNHEEVCLYLPKILGCQICSNLMRPPIFNCNLGHGVCFTCKDSINKCPTCENFWTNTRNNALESLTFNVKYPCKYNTLGCQEIDIESNIIKHEEVCPVNYKCPMLCNESGCFLFIKEHLEDAHFNMVYFDFQNTYGKSVIHLCSNSKETVKWMRFDSRVFRISYIRNETSKHTDIAVELVCSNGNPALYSYIIQTNVDSKGFSNICHKERSQGQPLNTISNSFYGQYFWLSIKETEKKK